MPDITSRIRKLGNPAADFAVNNGKSTTGGSWSVFSQYLARNVWDLQEFDDKIFIGVGDWFGAAGACPLLSYDPSTGDFYGEENGAQTVLSDAVERFCVVNGALVVPSVDPEGTGHDSLEYYRYETSTWRTYESSAYDTTHNFDMTYWDGSYWMATAFAGLLFELSGALGSGGSGGTTWTFDIDSLPDSAYGRSWKLFTLGDNLYMAADIAYTIVGGVNTATPGDYITKVTPGPSRTYSQVSGSNYAFICPGVAISAWANYPMLYRSVNFPDGDTVVYLVAEENWGYPIRNACKWTDGGSPSSILSALQGVRSGFTPTDLWTDGSTLYFLGYYTASSNTWVSVISTTDFSTYTEEFIFKSNDVNGGSQGQAYARSFEYMNGIWYFGMGSNLVANNNTGDILAYGKSLPPIFTHRPTRIWTR